MSTPEINLPTQEEILARYEARKADDFFGFEVSEYIEALDYEHAKQFLKDEVTSQEWTPTMGREAWTARMLDYMPFAWDKANNCRGISANRSVMHYIAWTWLAGDRDFSDEVGSMDYEYYGKPTLERICQFYGWDSKKWDNGVRTNGE